MGGGSSGLHQHTLIHVVDIPKISYLYKNMPVNTFELIYVCQ